MGSIPIGLTRDCKEIEGGKLSKSARFQHWGQRAEIAKPTRRATASRRKKGPPRRRGGATVRRALWTPAKLRIVTDTYALSIAGGTTVGALFGDETFPAVETAF